jgi:glycosyltransferase involved in cell wall biosynthesis
VFGAQTMRVVVLTTSYPRFRGDAAGAFVGRAVEELRRRSVEVEVVAPTRFRHYGVMYGSGIVGNLTRNPLLSLAIPAAYAAFVRAARVAAQGCDLVHAHWLPTGAVALAVGRPFVLTLHGTDVELARRAPRIARALLRRARAVICVSPALARAAESLGAERVRVVPNGVDVPADVDPEAEPPHVLFAGRLSREKGILELLAAANGHPVVVAGDGPLRSRVPQALGFVSSDELSRLYGRAAVVACPSHREGFGVVCAEAMAHGRPVVASAVGGLLDLVSHEQTGLLVPPRNVRALQAALERLLLDRDLRRSLGAAARDHVGRTLAWDRIAELLLGVYAEAAR